jgi:hypothetical protein
MTDQPKIPKGVTEAVLEASKAHLKLARSLQPPSYPSLDWASSISKLAMSFQLPSYPSLDWASNISKLGISLQVPSYPSLEILSKLGESVRPLSYFSPDVLTSISELGRNLQPLSYPSLAMLANISRLGMSLQPLSYFLPDMTASILKGVDLKSSSLKTIAELVDSISPFKAIDESVDSISKIGLGIQTSSIRAVLDAAIAQSKSLELSLIPLAQSLSDAIVQDNLRTKSGKLKPINQVAIATEALGIIAGVRNNKSLQSTASQIGRKLKQKPVSVRFEQIVKRSKQEILTQEAPFEIRNKFIKNLIKTLIENHQNFEKIGIFSLLLVLDLFFTIFVSHPMEKQALDLSKESLRQTEIQTSATLLPITSEREVRRNAKVRSKPGTGGSISELRTGDTVKLITYKGNYALIIFVDNERVAGQKGWVSRSALRLKKVSE